MLGHLAPKRYKLDLSNEVLYALVGEEAAKISEAKVGGLEKNFQRGQIRVRCTRGQAERADFLSISKQI